MPASIQQWTRSRPSQQSRGAHSFSKKKGKEQRRPKRNFELKKICSKTSKEIVSPIFELISFLCNKKKKHFEYSSQQTIKQKEQFLNSHENYNTKNFQKFLLFYENCWLQDSIETSNIYCQQRDLKFQNFYWICIFLEMKIQTLNFKEDFFKIQCLKKKKKTNI